MANAVVISEYFVRLRPMALGLSFAGVAVGNTVFPIVSSVLIANLGWRGTFLGVMWAGDLAYQLLSWV